MSQTSRMISDLTCAFGFKKATAEQAVGMYMAGQLTPAEQMAFQYLQFEDPFELDEENIGKAIPKPLVLQRGMQELMNSLNYRLTNGS